MKKKKKPRKMGKSFIGDNSLPPGLRNNNPGNMRPGSNWQGMIGTLNGFIVFQDCSWGLRALALDLTNAINEGYNTVNKLISHWAPPIENNTPAYIQSVCDTTGFDADETLTPDTATLAALMRAIMNVELGAQYSAMLTDSDIAEGISMAGGGSTGSAVAGSILPVALIAVLGYFILKG